MERMIELKSKNQEEEEPVVEVEKKPETGQKRFSIFKNQMQKNMNKESSDGIVNGFSQMQDISLSISSIQKPWLFEEESIQSIDDQSESFQFKSMSDSDENIEIKVLEPSSESAQDYQHDYYGVWQKMNSFEISDAQFSDSSN